MPDSDLLVPPGACLLHIGPPKTGTTAVQGALWRGREAMATHGVLYPGPARQHTKAARAVLGVRGPKGDPPVDPRCWQRLVREVSGAADRRVVVSSEAFSAAGDAAAAKIVSGLGGSRVHVVVTLRPLVKILPSAWHESVRQGQRRAYTTWLRHVLSAAPPDHAGVSFWHRHAHALLVERWASTVGRENVTVVVGDESDRLMLVRVFERLLGLPSGLLHLDPKTNPSLDFGEIETVRHVNREFSRRSWSFQRHRRLVRKGMTRHLQAWDRPGRGSERIKTPQWAVERAAEIGGSAADEIASLGVRVVGDLASLGSVAVGNGSVPAPRPVVHSETAMQAVVGTIVAAIPSVSSLSHSRRHERH